MKDSLPPQDTPASDPTIARGIYKTDKYGNKAEQMKRFDPTAEKIIASPQYVGG
jgi:hypothetical protein